MSLYLQELGPKALSYRHLVDEVKDQIGITHNEFDCWIYGFLENKKYNVKETVAKLHRRFAMEVNELATYTFTDYMRGSLRSGIIQVIGEDKEGRVVFYVVTARDRPTSAHREESKNTFDMMISYGTRLRANNKRCQMVMLINQDKASLWSNMDMTFQADIALRIAKFYPGCVDRIYVCNMNRTLTTLAKPIFSRLPSIVSDRIVIISEGDKKSGKLLEYFDEDVLPVALGGTNDCDHEENWEHHAVVIEEYFKGLKEAVLGRGLSVKEWELSCLETRRSMSDLMSTKSDLQNILSLKTCLSVEDGSSYDNAEIGVVGMDSNIFVEVREWKSTMKCFPQGLAIFFMEELQRWRLAVEDEEMDARYVILDDYIATRALMDSTVPWMNLEVKRWYKQIPVPLHVLCRFWLVALTVLNGIYFFAALIFLSVLGATVMATLFFGFFVKWNYIFPLSAPLAMAGVQSFALCSRAVEMLLAIAYKKVIPPFEGLGTELSAVVQISFFVGMVGVQFIVFCVYAGKYSPLMGLQVSFATGWISAVFFVAVCHLVFFLECFVSRQNRRKSREWMGFPFFFLWNMRETAEWEGSFYTVRTSSYVICGIPIFLSMFLGIAFLISRSVGFAVALCVSAVLASFTTTYYSDALSNVTTGSLLRFSLWTASLVWVFACYTFGFRNYNRTWFIPVIITSIIAIWFLVFSIICVKKNESHILVRIAIASALIFLCGAWISNFPVVGWKSGLFCICLLLHNALGILCNRYELTNVGGVFFVSAALLLVIMSCTLLGWYGTSLQVSLPRSLSREGTPSSLAPLAEYHQYPVCSLRTAGGLGIVDFALFTELVNGYSTDAFFVDFQNWFGTTDFSYSGVVQEFASDAGEWELYKFESTVYNQTVLTLKNKYALSSILATTAWLGSIALSPLHIFLPTTWSTAIVQITSFVTTMIEFPWVDIEKQLVRYLENFKNTETKELVLTSSGVTGGIASMAGAHAQTQTIVFGSPGLLHVLRLIDLSREEYHKYVLAVGAAAGVLDDVGGQDITLKQKLFCSGAAMKCLSMEYIASELVNSCDRSGRRHIPA